MYAVIEDLTKFRSFIENVHDNVEESVDLRQVLLVSDKQKIIFVCGDKADETLNKIQNYCKDVFKATLTTDMVDTMVQITIEDVLDNYKDSMYKFNLFKDQLDDRELAKSLSIIPTCKKQEHVYIQPSINKVLDIVTMEDLIVALKNIASGTTINNLIIGNNNVVGNDNNVNAQPLDKTQIARDWITANPPNENEYGRPYHGRYLVDHPNGLTINKFGTIVLDFKYEKKKTNKGTCWMSTK